MTVSGFGWHKLEAPPGSELLAQALAPYFNACIEHFGAQRCMFESNFPVDKECVSYRTLWNLFKRIASALGLSESEKTAMFSGTAARAYRLNNEP